MDYELIKELAKKKGLSIKKIGERVGMTDSGLYTAFINNTLKVDTLEKIADVLDVSVCQFFNETKIASNAYDKLRIMLKERIIEFDIDAFLSSLFWKNFNTIGAKLIDYTHTEFSKEDIALLIDRFEDEGLNDGNDFFYFIDKENGMSDHELCARYILLYYSRTTTLKSSKKKKTINDLQVLTIDKYLDLIKANQDIAFLVKEDIISFSDFNFRVQKFINQFLNIENSYRLMINKEMHIDSNFYSELSKFIKQKKEGL